MKEESKKKEVKCVNKYKGGSAGGAVYFFGFVGALIYYIQQSTTFSEGLIGFLKALVWPAFLIHRVFNILNL